MSSPNIQSVASLFQQNAGTNIDPASSSIIVANLNQSVMPYMATSPFVGDENETDDFKVFVFIGDASGSMSGVRQEVVEAFDDIVIPGLLGGAAPQVGAIRVGGLFFGGSGLKPMWKAGMQPLQQLPKLADSGYHPSGGTPLNQAIVAGVTMATKEALEIRDKTGTHPEVVIVVLSDGADTTSQHIVSDADVKKVVGGLSPELYTTVFIGFETGEPVDFNQVAKDLGFRDIVDSKPKSGETQEEQRRRFRHMMHVFSQSLVGRMSTSQVGKGAPASGPSGFWQTP